LFLNGPRRREAAGGQISPALIDGALNIDVHRNAPRLVAGEQLCGRAVTYRLANFLRRAKKKFMPIAAK